MSYYSPYTPYPMQPLYKDQNLKPKLDLETSLMYSVAKPKNDYADPLTDVVINGSINWSNPKNRKQDSKLLEKFRACYNDY